MSKFYVPVDINHTALLVADVQNQILSRFPLEVQEKYCSTVLSLIEDFRRAIATRREEQSHKGDGAFNGIPLIVHHVFPHGINANSFISPYNKLAKWIKELEAQGFFETSVSDPNFPQYAIPASLAPSTGWGGKDEIIIPKLSAGCFSSSELVTYLRARGVRHVVLCGLTTSGSVLGSARLGADMDFHVVIPREAVMDDNEDVGNFLLDHVLPKFVDVVALKDVQDTLI